jgi:hypothetical protein
VLLSDHGVGGGPKLVNVEQPIRRALRAGGFAPRKRLRAGNDVTLVPFGLLSGFVAFTADGREAEVAERIAAVEGVEACVAVAPPGAEAEEAWTVFAGQISATIERRENEGVVEWRYTAEDTAADTAEGIAEAGDPLGYADLAGPWRSDDDWYRAIADRRLPDALHRIDRAFELVRNPASLLCSVSPGFMYGATSTDLTSRITVGRLRWTHGGLESGDSLGFFMTDHPSLRSAGPTASGAVRFDRALEGLGKPEPR